MTFKLDIYIRILAIASYSSRKEDDRETIYDNQFTLTNYSCIPSETVLILLFTESKASGGFTFHQMTPSISDKKVNPAMDSALNIQLTTAEKHITACSTTSVCLLINNTANICY